MKVFEHCNKRWDCTVGLDLGPDPGLGVEEVVADKYCHVAAKVLLATCMPHSRSLLQVFEVVMCRAAEVVEGVEFHVYVVGEQAVAAAAEEVGCRCCPKTAVFARLSTYRQLGQEPLVEFEGCTV